MTAPTTRRRLSTARRPTAASLALGLLAVVLVGCDASSGGDVADSGSSSADRDRPERDGRRERHRHPDRAHDVRQQQRGHHPGDLGAGHPAPDARHLRPSPSRAAARSRTRSAACGCDAATVVGTLTPADGQAPGTVPLVAATGVLTVAGVAPIDGTRLTGTITGTPGPGVAVQWTGDGTGSAASLAVTCP